MPELSLQLILNSLTMLTAEIRSLRDEVRAFRSIRDEVGLLRHQISLLGEDQRATTTALHRLDDAITMDVMDRLQALEASRET